MFGHMLLLDCITSAVRYSMSTRLQPCHPKILVPPAGSCTSVLLDRFMVVLFAAPLPLAHVSWEPGSVKVWVQAARAEGQSPSGEAPLTLGTQTRSLLHETAVACRSLDAGPPIAQEMWRKTLQTPLSRMRDELAVLMVSSRPPTPPVGAVLTLSCTPELQQVCVRGSERRVKTGCAWRRTMTPCSRASASKSSPTPSFPSTSRRPGCLRLDALLPIPTVFE